MVIWTKKRPTIPGYYWVKRDKTHVQKKGSRIKIEDFCEEQPPRVVKVAMFTYSNDDSEKLYLLEAPDYDDGIPVDDLSEYFDWSSEPINLPVVSGLCGCANVTDGKAACLACAPVWTSQTLPDWEENGDHMSELGRGVKRCRGDCFYCFGVHCGCRDDSLIKEAL